MIIDEVIDVCERPIIFSAPMIRAILEGKKIQTRRVVKAPVMTARDGTKACGKMLFDLSRAFADHGFPTDDNGEVFPMERWLNGSDPAPESAYRYHYLHVPIAHPQDGWEANPRDDRQMRVYCPHGQPGDRLWVRETWADAMSDDGPVICYRADLDRRYLHLDAWPIEYDRYPGCKFANWASDLEGGIEGRWRPAIHMPRWASRITLEITGVRVERVQEIDHRGCVAEGWDGPEDKRVYIEAVGDGDDACVEWFADLWDSINAKSDHGWDANPWVWVIAFKSL